MLRTATVCGLVVLAGYAAAAWLTHDFQVWTDEGARRLEVALHPVPVPEVVVQGPLVPQPTLPALLRSHAGASIGVFVYTHCRSVCLSLGSSLQQVQRALQADAAAGRHAGVRLLSISFDGARDDPAALQAHAKAQRADPTLWHFVRVPDAAQQRALLQRLGVVVLDDGRGDFEHNAALLVFDPRGRMVRVFDMAEQQLALDYARHLARHTP